MLNASRNDSGVDRALAHRTKLGKRTKRKRQYQLESLESRTLLAYTFTYGGVNGPQVVDESGGHDSFTVVNNGFGLLEWSTTGAGGPFSTQWGPLVTDTLNASPVVSLTINLHADNSAIIDGDSTSASSAASAVQAKWHVFADAGNTADSLTVDDETSTVGFGTYSYTGSSGTITGPLTDIDIVQGGVPFAGGVTIQGNDAGTMANPDVFDVVNTYVDGSGVGEPVTILGGTGDDVANVMETTGGGTPAATATVNLGGGDNIVNVGSGSNVATSIGAAVIVTDPTTLNVDDSADATTTNITLDDNSGNPSAPYEVLVDGAAPIEYGTGVTALNVTGGTAGVTFDINNTQAGTTTTLTGGPTQNFFNLSNPTLAGGLDNLLGPVVVHGGSSLSDVVTLDDSDANFNDDYVVTSTTVTRPFFAGLTYDGDIGTLTLNAENTLGTNGNNTIDIDSTADFVVTNINGQGGVDTINVLGTGLAFGIGSLNVSTGDDDGSTVNVVANSEPVNVNLNSNDFVNIGSEGGPGTMTGINGPIDIIDVPSFYTLSFHDENDTTGNIWSLHNDDIANTASVSLNNGIGTTTYRPGDLASPLTINAGSGGNTFYVHQTTSFVNTVLNTGTGDDTVNVYSSGNFDDDGTSELDIHGQDGLDTVTLGAHGMGVGMQNLFGTIDVDNAGEFTTLILDDSEDTAGQTGTLTDNGVTGTVTGLSPATINYTDTDINSTVATTPSLLINLSDAGDNTFTVDGTLANPFFASTLTTIDKGTGDFNSVTVNATAAGSVLDLAGGASDGSDTVTINYGPPNMILGPVNIDEAPGSTNMVIDLTNDGLPHDFVLSSDGTTSTLHDELGNLPDITYTTAALSSLTIDTDPAFSQTLNIDMGEGGNPIPVTAMNTAGLFFNADGDGSNLLPPAGTHSLNIYGELPTGPFASETHNANDQTVFPQVGQYGSIYFADGVTPIPNFTGLDYTGLQPIVDVTPVFNYTFNDFGYPDQSFTATDGTALGFNTIKFTNIPTPATPLNFETTDISNKVNVTFATPSSLLGVAGAGVTGIVNVPTAYTPPLLALASLTFDTPTNAANGITFVAVPDLAIPLVPPGPTTYDGGTANDTTNVLGVGIPAGTNLDLFGGPGSDTLNYNADGAIPSVTSPSAGIVVISIPGQGTVTVHDYNHINIVNAAPTPPTPIIVTNLNSIEGFQLVNAVVGTFMFPLGGLPFSPTPAPLPASDFSATIAWGDGSTTAGMVVQDASDPSEYYVEGTHTYTDPGLFSSSVTVTFAGASVSGRVGDIPVTITLPSTTGTLAGVGNVNVIDGTLAVTAFPLVGTEGAALPGGPVGTFIDAGGVDVGYTASAVITNAAGLATLVPSGDFSITEVGSSEEFTVSLNAGAVTLPEEGTYQFVLSVTDPGPPAPFTASGAAVAVIADAALTGTPFTLSASTGEPYSGIVADFTDANTLGSKTDFTATIDWGDGSPNSIGTIVGAAGIYSVDGTHTYAKFGTYTTTVIVTDVGGSEVTISGTATVTDPAITGVGHDFTSVEGQPSGTVLLGTITDPNTLATAADITALLTAWGDGTPTTPFDLTVVQTSSTPTDTVFNIFGDHTYHEEGSFTFSITVSTLDPANPAITVTGTATVVDATLNGTTGNEITEVEGTSSTSPPVLVLGTFTDTNPFSPTNGADFLPTTTVNPTPPPATGNGGLMVVNWGDGSPLQDLTSFSNISGEASPTGVLFTISATHVYATAGTYAYSISVLDAGGSTTVVSGSAIISPAPLSLTAVPATPHVVQDEPNMFPVPVFAPPLFTGPVAYFTTTNLSTVASDFMATIDWGDGTTPTAGVVVGPITPPPAVGVNTFEILGSHTYASELVGTTPGSPGHPAIQVFVTSTSGAKLEITNTNTTIVSNTLTVTGVLNPTSDSGLSTNSPNDTNDSQPDFYGTVTATPPPGSGFTSSSEGFAEVTLYATSITTGTVYTLGTTQADSGGNWNIKSDVTLPDDEYNVTAKATDQFGDSLSTNNVIYAGLLIDTVGPVITSMTFGHIAGQIDYTIVDPTPVSGGPVSGVWVNSLLDASNYLLTKVHANKAHPGQWQVSDVTATPDPTIPNAYDVVVTINGGAPIKGGYYLFTIRDSSNGSSSVQDQAENHLDGVFYGTFPSGNGINGSDFVAELSAVHHTVFAPGSIIGGSSAADGGVDPPAGGSHTKPKHVKVKPVVKIERPVVKKTAVKVAGGATAAVRHSATNANALDHAIEALVVETKSKGKSK